MKTCSELEILEQLQIPRFIIPPYHVISQYDGGNLYYHPQSQIGVYYIIPNSQTGVSLTTHFPDISIWRVPNDPNCPFFNQYRPCSRLATRISYIQGPLPFYTAEESNACKSTIQSELIYLTREGDKVNNRALTIHVAKTRLVIALSVLS